MRQIVDVSVEMCGEGEGDEGRRGGWTAGGEEDSRSFQPRKMGWEKGEGVGKCLVPRP